MRKTKAQLKDKHYVSSLFDDIFRDPNLDKTRFLIELSWYRNILYYMGEQWLSWFDSTNSFGRRYELGANVPTPVTNIIRDHIKSMKALIINKQFNYRVWPNSEEQVDKDAAEMGQNVLKHLDSEEDYEIENVKEMIAFWTVLTGNGFSRTYANVDDDRVECDYLLPFNIIVPHLGRSLEKKEWIGIKSLKSKDWVEETYNIDVTHTESELGYIEYEQQLLKLVANVSPWKGRGLEMDMTEDEPENYVLFKELEFQPSKFFPKGRYIVMAGDKIVKDQETLPIPVEDKRWEYTVTHFPYNFTPGMFWATSGVDDLISPQNIINETDQALAINRQSLGRPMIMSHSDLTYRRRSPKGQALLEIIYNGRTGNGKPPVIHPGTPYPSQILDERQMQINGAQDASGDPKSILKGQAPTAGASGVMVDILKEAAEQSHSPDIQRFYRAWGKVQRKRLMLVQKLWKTKHYIKVSGLGNRIMVKAFKGANLRDNTDVRLEPDNALSSTQAGRNELMVRLIQGGFFGDITQQPQLQRDLGEKLGLGQIPSEDNLHRDRAEYENGIIAYGTAKDFGELAMPSGPIPDEMGNPIKMPDGENATLFPESYDPVFRYDNHPLHIETLLSYMLSREFRDLDLERQQYARGHLDMHMEAAKLNEIEEVGKAIARTGLGFEEGGAEGAPVLPQSGEAPPPLAPVGV
jgi:hypothetical protein